MKYQFKPTALVVLLVLFSGPLFAVQTCSKEAYKVVFFNGVWNTQNAANDSLQYFKAIFGDQYQGVPIKYEVLYNTTGSTAGASIFQDLAETFIQRSQELDASGELGARWEYFWESLNGQKTLTQKLASLFPNTLGVIDSLYTSLSTKLVAAFARTASNPPTITDMAAQQAKLDSYALQNNPVLLIGHSQGNLFLNAGYDYTLPKLGQGALKAYQIAPASPTLRGDYTLATADIIINLLRLQGINSVPDTNLSLSLVPVSSADASGHRLIETYLDTKRGARPVVEAGITQALASLAQAQAQTQTASLKAAMVTLTSNKTVAAVGDTVTLSASISPTPTPTPTTATAPTTPMAPGGTVTFTDQNANVLCSAVTLNAGTATCSTTITTNTPITNLITAQYSGDCVYLPQAAGLNISVAQGKVPSLNINPTSVQMGEPITFTATVPTSAMDATGTVTFKDQDGNTLCAAATVVNGGASCSTITSPPATITAQFSGNSQFPPSSNSISVPLASTCTTATAAPGSGCFGGMSWKAIGQSKNWLDANAACAASSFDPMPGWRLPTAYQLQGFFNSAQTVVGRTTTWTREAVNLSGLSAHKVVVWNITGPLGPYASWTNGLDSNLYPGVCVR